MWNTNGGGAVVAGTKRKADESNLQQDSDRFTKRFNLLNLDGQHNGHSNYYIPISNPPSPIVGPVTVKNAARAAAAEDNGMMEVDDTRDRVYIHNLDDELADIESDEEKLIFLPDIEKKLSRLPSQVLTGRKDEEYGGQELVLYGMPKLLTADDGTESVRKAMIAMKQRAREKAAEDARRQDMNCKYDQSSNFEPAETAHGYSSGYVVGEVEDEDEMDNDPDAMEMD